MIVLNIGIFLLIIMAGFGFGFCLGKRMKYKKKDNE